MIIAIVTIIGLIVANLFFPVFKIGKIKFASFWVITSIGALLLLPQIDLKSLFQFEINPFTILILFICVTILSLILDETGFFILLANKICHQATNQRTLFTLLFVLISILTIFTSNDVIILTFTPFIIALTKRINVNPLPYLFSQFVAANTFSLVLLIGNPTNIFIGLSFDISFMAYLKVMFLPSLAGGIVAFLMCYCLFRKELSKDVDVVIYNEASQDQKSKKIMIIALGHLSLTTFLLAISHIINIEMWKICLLFACSMSVVLVLMDYRILFKALKRAPWNLVPFIISMFIIILAINNAGFNQTIGNWLLEASNNNNFVTVFLYGLVSIISDNLINNIPMSLFAINVLENANLHAVYAVIVGSNLGAYLTPIGAMAGIMWMSMLQKKGVAFSFFQFVKYGFSVVFVTAFVTLLTLFLVLL